MNEGGYIVIQDWMLDLDLDIYETTVLAIIYGFSQDGESTFKGSQNYLAKKVKCTRQKIVLSLKKLVAKGYIDKIDVNARGVKLCEYRMSMSFTRCKCHLQDVNEMHKGCKRRLHNNEYINKDNIYMYKGEPFDFHKALLAVGISQDVARAWLQVRKTKRATNTEIAFKKIISEIEKSGMTPEQAIRMAVENSWSGFRAEWAQPSKPAKAAARQKGESVLERNLRVMDDMFDTNLHEQVYNQNQKNDYDEQ